LREWGPWYIVVKNERIVGEDEGKNSDNDRDNESIEGEVFELRGDLKKQMYSTYKKWFGGVTFFFCVKTISYQKLTSHIYIDHPYIYNQYFFTNWTKSLLHFQHDK
jgi:hypothetical protein